MHNSRNGAISILLVVISLVSIIVTGLLTKTANDLSQKNITSSQASEVSCSFDVPTKVTNGVCYSDNAKFLLQDNYYNANVQKCRDTKTNPVCGRRVGTSGVAVAGIDVCKLKTVLRNAGWYPGPEKSSDCTLGEPTKDSLRALRWSKDLHKDSIGDDSRLINPKVFSELLKYVNVPKPVTNFVTKKYGDVTSLPKYKNRNIEVCVVQQVLNNASWHPGPKPDANNNCYYDDATLQSVKAFSRANGVHGDGSRVDDVTWRVLEKYKVNPGGPPPPKPKPKVIKENQECDVKSVTAICASGLICSLSAAGDIFPGRIGLCVKSNDQKTRNTYHCDKAGKADKDCKSGYCNSSKKCADKPKPGPKPEPKPTDAVNPGGNPGGDSGSGSTGSGSGTGGGGGSGTGAGTSGGTTKSSKATIKVNVVDDKGKPLQVQIGRAYCDLGKQSHRKCTVGSRKSNISSKEFPVGKVPADKEFVGAMVNIGKANLKFVKIVDKPNASVIKECFNQGKGFVCAAWPKAKAKSGDLKVTFVFTKTIATITPTPTPGGPTCIPRPACLDAHPACKIPVIANMCPPITPTPTPKDCPDTEGPDQEGLALCQTPTPEPTETPEPKVNVSVALKLSQKIQGIISPPEGSKLMFKVKLAGGELSAPTDYKEAEFTSSTDRLWTGTVTFNVPEGDGYYVLVKGEKHLQRKICDEVPTESVPATYSCGEGKITLSDGDNNLDFSGIFIIAGDIPVNGRQNGVIDSEDLSYIRQHLGSKDEAVLKIADLNLDGIVDSQDFSLVIAGLSVRSDEQ